MVQLLILLCVAIRGVPQLPDQGRPQHHQVRPQHYDGHGGRQAELPARQVERFRVGTQRGQAFTKVNVKNMMKAGV